MINEPAATICEHLGWVCLNQHELIRNYRCQDRGAVIMCAGDEAFGRRFLTHQLREGCELKTQERIPVTHGFQPGIYSECRSLSADPAPGAAIPGRTARGTELDRFHIYFQMLIGFNLAKKPAKSV